MGNIVGGIVGGVLGRGSGRRQARGIEAAGQQAFEQLEPFIEPGVEANQAILAALGQGGPEAAAQQDAAFQNFLGSTGFRAALGAGQDAITGSAAARGLLNSGATARGLTSFGQDLAQQGFTNFLGQLGTVANRGVGAAGAGSSILQRAGEGAAGARAGGDAAFQSGIGQAAQGIFSRIGFG